MSIENLWEEYYFELSKDNGTTIKICGLCGNSGVLNTINSAFWNDKSVGVKRYCICPNGRYLKDM